MLSFLKMAGGIAKKAVATGKKLGSKINKVTGGLSSAKNVISKAMPEPVNYPIDQMNTTNFSLGEIIPNQRNLNIKLTLGQSILKFSKLLLLPFVALVIVILLLKKLF